MRVWLTTKQSDPWFFSLLTISFLLFTLEILVTSVVNDDYKYSFFFNLDIIATFSLVSDIPWMLESVKVIVGSSPAQNAVNVIPGVWFSENVASNKLHQVFKSLRLIRLIRVMKLYKYVIASMSEKEEGEGKQEQIELEEDNQSLF